ncbi:MAG: histidine--tRNA ligase [Waddliaceae bacterium]
MRYQCPRGVFDIIPNHSKENWQTSHLWDHVESTIRETAKNWGFQEIRTPIFERTELFQRSVGEDTDIVTKEMYTFDDRSKRSMTLRPEGTAAVIRSYLEQHLDHKAPVQKLFYIGPMFRYERAQAGRYRQHHQFGVEAIGVASPEQDAEVIDLLYTVFSRLGIKDLKIQLNSIGNKETRSEYRKMLREYLGESLQLLSEESQTRFQTNPFRILDSKDLRDQEILKNAPPLINYLDEESKEHFENVQMFLKKLKIPYEINPRLVRGLDYYNRTVFEITTESLGAQNSIAGGGRYDGLIQTLGGPEIPALGFGAGLERIIQTLINQNSPIPPPQTPVLYLIPLGDDAKNTCFTLTHQLRADGIFVQMDYSGKKLGKMMTTANNLGATFVAVVGEEELAKEEVELKEMATGTIHKAPLFNLSRILRVEAKGDDFIEVWKEMNEPFDHPLEASFFLNKIKHSIEETSELSETLKDAMKKMEELL